MNSYCAPFRQFSSLILKGPDPALWATSQAWPSSPLSLALTTAGLTTSRLGSVRSEEREGLGELDSQASADPPR